jgi:hypothetical protein
VLKCDNRDALCYNEKIMKKATILRVIQTLLGALFIYGGGTKLFMPAAELMRQIPLDAAFMKTIGGLEALGGVSLALAGLFGAWQGLARWAAAGLAVIMVGATTLTMASGAINMALLPAAAGILAIWLFFAARAKSAKNRR